MFPFRSSLLPWLFPACFLFLAACLALHILRSFWVGSSTGVVQTELNRGMCLEENVEIVFPGGVVREGSVWQHTHGARCIYAAVTVDGRENYYSLDTHQWIVNSVSGRPVYQGM